MESEKYLAQLQEIQSMMQKSSKFLSLSGLSGILAGTYALIGAGIVYSMRERLSSPVRFDSVELAAWCGILGVIFVTLGSDAGAMRQPQTDHQAWRNRRPLGDAALTAIQGKRRN